MMFDGDSIVLTADNEPELAIGFGCSVTGHRSSQFGLSGSRAGDLTIV